MELLLFWASYVLGGYLAYHAKIVNIQILHSKLHSDEEEDNGDQKSNQFHFINYNLCAKLKVYIFRVSIFRYCLRYCKFKDPKMKKDFDNYTKCSN